MLGEQQSASVVLWCCCPQALLSFPQQAPEFEEGCLHCWAVLLHGVQAPCVRMHSSAAMSPRVRMEFFRSGEVESWDLSISLHIAFEGC